MQHPLYPPHHLTPSPMVRPQVLTRRQGLTTKQQLLYRPICLDDLVVSPKESCRYTPPRPPALGNFEKLLGTGACIERHGVLGRRLQTEVAGCEGIRPAETEHEENIG